MQILEITEGLLGAAQIDTRGVCEILPRIGGHGAHIAQRACRIRSSSREALGAEDQQPEHAEDEDLSQADVEHALSVRRYPPGRLTAWSSVLSTAQDDHDLEGAIASAGLDADILAGEAIPDSHDQFVRVGHRALPDTKNHVASTQPRCCRASIGSNRVDESPGAGE